MSDIHSTDYRLRLKDGILGAQMLFVAFGALVLVPILVGLDANVALFTAGAGTLVFQAITRGKVPVFLASSFAFIAPIQFGVAEWGIPGTLCGLFAAGLLYVVLSFVVRWGGVNLLKRILPPVVTGPVIMVIGLILAPVAVNMALGLGGDGSVVLVPSDIAIPLALASLAATILFSLLGKGWVKLIPILGGIAVGYLLSLIFDITGLTGAAFDTLTASRTAIEAEIANQVASGAAVAPLIPSFAGPELLNFSAILKAPWLAVPNFTFPSWSNWNWAATLFIVPVAIAPAIEHFGDVLAIGGITGKDYVKDPGIKNTLLGDGIATSLAAALGGPPNTTYSEVSGAVALTRSFNPAIMTWAAVTAVLLAFVGKLGGVLQTIPTPVMGGIMILLFGAITTIGINTLVKSGDDLMQARNMAIVALILVIGIGGLVLPIGDFLVTVFGWVGVDLTIGKMGLEGIGLAGILGVVLNLVLPGRKAAESARPQTSPEELIDI